MLEFLRRNRLLATAALFLAGRRGAGRAHGAEPRARRPARAAVPRADGAAPARRDARRAGALADVWRGAVDGLWRARARGRRAARRACATSSARRRGLAESRAGERAPARAARRSAQTPRRRAAHGARHRPRRDRTVAHASPSTRGPPPASRKGAAVLAPGGLVGQVFLVSPHAARVLLVTDHNSGVDAVVQRTRGRGIVEGTVDGRLRPQVRQAHRGSPGRRPGGQLRARRHLPARLADRAHRRGGQAGAGPLPVRRRSSRRWTSTGSRRCWSRSGRCDPRAAGGRRTEQPASPAGASERVRRAVAIAHRRHRRRCCCRRRSCRVLDSREAGAESPARPRRLPRACTSSARRARSARSSWATSSTRSPVRCSACMRSRSRRCTSASITSRACCGPRAGVPAVLIVLRRGAARTRVAGRSRSPRSSSRRRVVWTHAAASRAARRARRRGGHAARLRLRRLGAARAARRVMSAGVRWRDPSTRTSTSCAPSRATCRRSWRRRIGVAAAIVLVAFIAIVARLVSLQVVQGREMRSLSEHNRIRLVRVPSARGVVYDRNGELLIDNRAVVRRRVRARGRAATGRRCCARWPRISTSPRTPSIERLRAPSKRPPYEGIVDAPRPRLGRRRRARDPPARAARACRCASGRAATIRTARWRRTSSATSAR